LSKIQFGIEIPQGWSYDLLLNKQQDEEDPIKQYEFSKHIAEVVDKFTAFDSIYAYDHFLPYYAPNDKKSFFECFTLLSAIATITNRVKVGQVVTCNSYRNPALLAKMLSTLDIISNGRVELGIGAGWHKDEYLQYGYDFPSASTRIKQLDESISIIKSMWTQERANFSGKNSSVKNAICNPKPLQKPYPPVMIGGEGEKYLLKVVAKHANRYNNPCGSVQILKRKISILKEHCAAIGRDYKDIEYSVLLSCLIRETEDEVKGVVNQRQKQVNGVQQVRAAEYTSMIGTPENVMAGLNKYIELGLTHFILDFVGLDGKTLELFNSKIIKSL